MSATEHTVQKKPYNTQDLPAPSLASKERNFIKYLRLHIIIQTNIYPSRRRKHLTLIYDLGKVYQVRLIHCMPLCKSLAHTDNKMHLHHSPRPFSFIVLTCINQTITGYDFLLHNECITEQDRV